MILRTMAAVFLVGIFNDEEAAGILEGMGLALLAGFLLVLIMYLLFYRGGKGK